MTSIRLIALGLAALLAGCVNLRPDIHRPPTEKQLSAAAAAQYTGPVNGTLNQYISYLDQLASWHQAQSDTLLTDGALLSELGFVGAVVGVIAGASEHTNAARRAAMVAGGSTLIADRYSIKVQAGNYERAADAFICMRDKVIAKTKTLSPTVPVRALADDTASADAIQDNALVVLRKLRKVQRDIAIATPTAQQIQDALGMTVPKGGGKSPSGEKMSELQKDMITCAATF